MGEIEEIMPLYICERAYNKGICFNGNKEECFEDCNHTSYEAHARNKEAVDVFKKFSEMFSCIIDENGRLIVYERE